MLATNAPNAPSDVAPQRHDPALPAAGSGVREDVSADDESDDFAAARGLLLGAALGAACLGVLALAGWWLL
jgi:hypothetical protein